jgi:hypothetical protein
MVMKVKTQHLWDAVWYGDADFSEDRRALEELHFAVPPEMHSSLVNKETHRCGMYRQRLHRSCVRSGRT